MENEKKSCCCCGTPAQPAPEAAAENCCPAAADTEGAACCRHKDRTPEEHKALLNRLSRCRRPACGQRGKAGRTDKASAQAHEIKSSFYKHTERRSEILWNNSMLPA